MDADGIAGWIIIAAALGFITYLLIWSHSMIERIANKKLRSIREIMKNLHNGR